MLLKRKDNFEYRNMLTVDPGYNTGWAFWYVAKCPETGLIKENTTNNNLPTIYRVYYLSLQFEDLLYRLNPSFCVIEDVNLWGGSEVSQASTAKGYTFGLAFLISMYAQNCLKRNIPVELVTVNTWKGNMNAKAVEYWIYNIDSIKYKEHIKEAVGIGYWKQGYFDGKI